MSSSENEIGAAEFANLKASVDTVSGNPDQLFLIVMGCVIFCKYAEILVQHM